MVMVLLLQESTLNVELLASSQRQVRLLLQQPSWGEQGRAKPIKISVPPQWGECRQALGSSASMHQSH